MNKGKLLPPIYLLFYFLLALVLHNFLPIKQIITGDYENIGWIFIGLGIFINIWAFIYFRKFHTTIKPYSKSDNLIDRGPFKFSRNPIYLGYILVLIGVVINLGSVATIVTPIGLFITINVIFISYEEKELDEEFGEEYIKYKKRVRRWI